MFAVAALVALQAAIAAPALDRVSEEASKLAERAPSLLGTETVEQTTFKRERPFLRIASGGRVAPVMKTEAKHSVVSEFSFGRLKGALNGPILEFREVVSADGKQVRTQTDARRALQAGTEAGDEHVRRGMLEEFGRFLPGSIASDYSLLLVNFAGTNLDTLHVVRSGEVKVDGAATVLYLWEQRSTNAGEIIFAGDSTARVQLSGKIWVRKSDGLPVRIWGWAAHKEDGRYVRDEATVDYVMSRHDCLVPATVLHVHTVEGEVVAENRYTYSPFQLLEVDTEVRFR